MLGSHRETGSFGVLEFRQERESREGAYFGRRSLGIFRVLGVRGPVAGGRFPGCRPAVADNALLAKSAFGVITHATLLLRRLE